MTTIQPYIQPYLLREERGFLSKKGQNEKKIIMERKLKLNKKIKKINNNNNHRQKQKWPKIQI